MMTELTIWIDDDEGNKVNMERKRIRTLEEALRVTEIAWKTLTESRKGVDHGNPETD